MTFLYRIFLVFVFDKISKGILGHYRERAQGIFSTITLLFKIILIFLLNLNDSFKEYWIRRRTFIKVGLLI